MFYQAFQYDYGLANNILSLFGIEKINWITENTAMFLVLVPIIWQYVGFYFVIFLTAIANVPGDIYESAALDGVTGFHKTVHITIPIIKEVIVTTAGLVIAGSLKVFDIVYVMTNGGPLDASQLLSTYQYQQAFVYNDQGYSSAISVLIIVLGISIYIITNKLSQRNEGLE
jgi:raffinose/stachyose/melibiose transport system permease protein